MIKQQPNAVELEKAVLGAILLEREAIHEVSFLKAEHFYHTHHQSIYSTITEMMMNGKPLDILSLGDQLKGKGELEKMGGMHFITGLTVAVVSSAHIVSHARTVVEKYLKREQIRIASELLNVAYDESTDAFQSQEEAETQLHSLNESLSQHEAVRIDSVVFDVIKEIEELRHRGEYLIGTTSGYPSVDKITMGWQVTDLIILAARPAIGKTAFALSLARHAAQGGVPTAFFSLEMGAKQLVKRILASKSSMYLSTIKSARLNDEQMNTLWTKGAQPVSALPLFIDDTASMSVLQLKAKLRRLKRNKGVKIAFVDYLQLLRAGTRKDANRHEVIGNISRELKIAAKELDMPIIVLSQLSRAVEQRKGTPQLSDLKESGDIEQDADMVCFLYGHDEKAIEQEQSLASEIFFKIAKHRNGVLDTIKFLNDKDYQTFTDYGIAPEEEKKQKLLLMPDNNPFG